MRALNDTNVLINNLLSPAPAASATGLIFAAALRGAFTLLLTVGVTDELGRKLREDPALARRLPPADAEELLALLGSVAEAVPLLAEPYPEVGRARKDDFLLAHNVVAQADYLITWDKDRLVLGEVAGVRIVSPPAFLQALRTTSLA